LIASSIEAIFTLMILAVVPISPPVYYSKISICNWL
jgi:hypothetical protein